MISVWYLEIRTRVSRVALSLVLLFVVTAFLFVALALVEVQFHNATRPIDAWKSDLLVDYLLPLSKVDELAQDGQVAGIYYMTSPGGLSINGKGINGSGYFTPDLNWLRSFPETAAFSGIPERRLDRESASSARAVLTFPLARSLRIGVGDTLRLQFNTPHGPSPELTVTVAGIETYSHLFDIFIEQTPELNEWLHSLVNPLDPSGPPGWVTRVALELNGEEATALAMKERLAYELQDNSAAVTAAEFREAKLRGWLMFRDMESGGQWRVTSLAALLVALVFGTVFGLFVVQQLRQIWVVHLLGMPLHSIRLMLCLEPLLLALVASAGGIALGRYIIMNALYLYVDLALTWRFGLALSGIVTGMGALAATVVVTWSLVRAKNLWLRHVGGDMT